VPPACIPDEVATTRRGGLSMIDRYVLIWQLRDLRRSLGRVVGWILLILVFLSIAIWLIEEFLPHVPHWPVE
jgi:hypothetical protein